MAPSSFELEIPSFDNIKHKQQKITGLQSLPQELFDSITKYLLPLSYLNLGRAFENAKTKPGFDDDRIKASRVWDRIFENEKWLEAVISFQSGNVSPPLPVLVGEDINKLYQGHADKSYLILAYSDYSGDFMHEDIKLADSLRPNTYDERVGELNINGSNITISLENPCKDHMTIRDPQRLFSIRGSQPQTAALFYADSAPTEIGTDEIGGLVKNDQLIVENICTIPIRFRDGAPSCILVQRIGHKSFHPWSRERFDELSNVGELVRTRWQIRGSG